MSDATFHGGKVELLAGDCLERLKDLPDCSVDSVCTDPPYHLTSIVKRFGAKGAAAAKDYSGEREGATGAYARASRGFMGQQWDGGDIAFRVELWAEVWRVLKPGGHLVAFSGTRTYHRMAVAIEDAGFEVRDMIAWLYGSGFPKSHNVSKAIDKALGAKGELGAPRSAAHADMLARGVARRGEKHAGWDRPWMDDPEAIERSGRRYIPATGQAAAWEGWGSALKPALEPICFARKPLSEGSIAANVLAHGVGALNIDACLVEAREARVTSSGGMSSKASPIFAEFSGLEREAFVTERGRWPANVCHDGSDEVVGAFPDSGVSSGGGGMKRGIGVPGRRANGAHYDGSVGFGDSGSAARFFYSAKADADDRLGSGHPTVKPLNLMRWLVRLITPPGGRVLDPFAGTGTTGHAALLEGFRATLIEREENYRADITRRLENAFAHERERKALIIKAKGKVQSPGALFAGVEDAPPGCEQRPGSSTDVSPETDDRAQAMSGA